MVVICNKKYANTEKYNHEMNAIWEKYPYELSDFQKYAIDAIYQGDHVLITAHTGSGKTLPAEFAIQHFVSRKKKVIYTSPIKALSNQKYYDFSQKYPHISFGLFTGDIKTNPQADVLIMTTEILMNSLFSSQENKISNVNSFSIDISNELAAVVFDEVHYINDPDRGQNWEKTLMMLPFTIQKIMLSATIDSPERFAAWVEGLDIDRIKRVHLCSTNHRVVPLSHYGYMVYPESAIKKIKEKEKQQEARKLLSDFIPLQNDKGIFLESGFKTLQKIESFFPKEHVHRKYVLNQLAQNLRDKEMLPAIAFVFSRKNVELFAQDITIPLLEDDSKIPYIVQRECNTILRKLPNYEEYIHLPEYIQLVALLEKGVGIHHSGMIPILREIVEFMISKKYIRFLFATESFAIGLDCPIKTAIFTGIKKFDGQDHRYLLSHEYTQMAGRAGRRGIDIIGHVIHCNNLIELPCQKEYRDMLSGKAPNLVSKFRISYTWILSLLSKNIDSTKITENVLELSKKSMIHDELINSILFQKERIESLSLELEKSQKSIWRNSEEITRKYIEILESSKTATNKKKKESIRELENMKIEYRGLEEDKTRFLEKEKIKKEVENENKHLDYLETYMKVQIEKVEIVLEENGFLYLENGEKKWTINGNIASKIAEVHPLVWTNCIVNKWEFMAALSVKQIIGILSCITDIKVPEDYRSINIKTSDIFLKTCLVELQNEYLKYQTIENDREMRTGMTYDDVLSFDILEESIMWCDCNTIEECKYFIQTELSKKEISLGDFTKAMLKIATIAREWSGIEAFIDNPDFLYKLGKVEESVLKYIATTQSLYV